MDVCCTVLKVGQTQNMTVLESLQTLYVTFWKYDKVRPPSMMTQHPHQGSSHKETRKTTGNTPCNFPSFLSLSQKNWNWTLPQTSSKVVGAGTSLESYLSHLHFLGQLLYKTAKKCKLANQTFLKTLQTAIRRRHAEEKTSSWWPIPARESSVEQGGRQESSCKTSYIHQSNRGRLPFAGRQR